MTYDYDSLKEATRFGKRREFGRSNTPLNHDFKGTTVCEGYANVFQLLATKSGLSSARTGVASPERMVLNLTRMEPGES